MEENTYVTHNKAMDEMMADIPFLIDYILGSDHIEEKEDEV